MSALTPKSRAVWRWLLPGLLVGAVVGSTVTWWWMRRVTGEELQRLARLVEAEQSGPRVPGAPGVGTAKAGSSTLTGAATGVVPVIEVTENLEVAFRQLLGIKDPGVRQAAIIQFLDRLPRDRWGGFLAAVERVAGRGEFDDEPGSFMAGLGMMESVFAHMMKRAPEALLSQVRETRDGVETNDDAERDDGIANTAFRFWAGHDLPAAMAYFEKEYRSLPPDKQADAAKGLAREYVKKDPDAAFVWIKGLPKENQAQVAHGAFQTLSHTDSEAALRFLVTEKELPNRDEFAEQMAKGWAATKPEEALAWAKGLPEDLSPRAVQGAMEHLAEKDFEGAIREASVLTPAQRDHALKALADNVTSDPSRVSAILQLVERAPEGPGRVEAARNTLQKWTEADPEAASAWVAAQPDGPTRDSAIQGFGSAAVASKKDPEAGLEWTAAMSQPELRRNGLRENVKSWSDFDAEAARTWVQSSPRLNDADREVLLPLTRK